MKKTLFVISLFSILLLTSCFFSIKDDNEDNPIYDSNHEHTYTEHYYYDDDKHYRHCTYDKCESVEIEQHSLSEIILNEATHFEEGTKKIECDKCNYKLEEKYNVEHTLIYYERVEPTCSSYGYEGYYECTECKNKFKNIVANKETQINDIDEIKISKLKHGEKIKYEYFPATTSISGRIYIYCECGYRLGDIGTYPYAVDLDETVAYYKVVDIKCLTNSSENIYLKKEFITSLVDELYANPASYMIDNIKENVLAAFEECGLFSTPIYSKSYAMLEHSYGINMVKNPSNVSSGLYNIYCTRCNEIIKNNNNEDHTKIEDGTKMFLQAKKVDATCEEDGYCEYEFYANFLLNDIKEKYSIIDKVDVFTYYSFDTSKLNVDNYTIKLTKTGHEYETYITNPDINNDGTFAINCKKCTISYSNTDTKLIPISLGSSYFTSTTTATCISDGVTTYKYNELFKDLIKNTFNISIEDVNKFLAGKLSEINIEQQAFNHSYVNHIMKIVKYPTLEDEGKLVFLCDRVGCSHLREISDYTTELAIPIISDSSYYDHTDTSTCSYKGIITASIKNSWFYDNIPQEWSDRDNYIKDNTISTLLKDFTYEGDYKSHFYNGDINYDDFILKLHCMYIDCSNKTLLVNLPKAPNSIYTVSNNYVGNCKTESYINYSLPSDRLYKYLSEYDGLADIYNFINVNSISNKFNYKAIGDKNYNIHVGDLKFDSLYGIEFPNYKPGYETFGKYVSKCSECKRNTDSSFAYSSGTWIFKTGYASRVYQFDGEIHTDPRQYTKFSYQIDYGEGQLETSSPTSGTIEYGSDTSFSFSVDDFYLLGKGYAVDIEVYIDNVYHKSSDMFYKDTILGDLHFFFDCNINNGYGNIFLKVIYKE